MKNIKKDEEQGLHYHPPRLKGGACNGGMKHHPSPSPTRSRLTLDEK
jgi:hypothetical protein